MLRLQSSFNLILVLTVFAIVVSACGGGEVAPTNTPRPSDRSLTVEAEAAQEILATDAPTLEPSITPSPNLPPPTAIPLEVQLGDLPAGQYNFSMVGALNSDIGFTPFDTGLTGAEYTIAPDGTNLNGPYEFILWSDILTDGTTDDTTARIIFTIPASIGAGTHPVVGRDAMSSPSDIGVEVVTGFQSQRFGATANGTLTIVSNGGAGGVFTGEFEVTVGDEAGNTILATGRASAIGFKPEESAELTISGAIEVAPEPANISYTLSRTNNAANADWQLDLAVPANETNPYVVLNRLYMTPNISIGTYEIQPRVSELDARPEDLDVTAFVEIFDTTNGTRIEGTDVSGTLEVIDIRNSFTARFTLTYNMNGESITTEGGVFYLFKPAQ